jgi:hypothetical protein
MSKPTKVWLLAEAESTVFINTALAFVADAVGLILPLINTIEEDGLLAGCDPDKLPPKIDNPDTFKEPVTPKLPVI